jgi:hypothetical protein
MPSTYTNNLGIELPADGELDGVWGEVVNDNMDILDRAINGVGAITLSGTTHTLTTSNGVLSDGQYAILLFGGSPSGTNTVTISPNDAQHIYIVRNSSGQSVVLTQGSGGNVTVPNGGTAIVYCDGAGAGAAVVDLSFVTLTQAQTLTNKTLTDPALIGTITEDVYTITDGAAFEIDPGNGSVQLITLGASRTPKATNFASGESITLMVDDGSAYTLTWTDATFGGSGVVWKTALVIRPLCCGKSALRSTVPGWGMHNACT